MSRTFPEDVPDIANIAAALGDTSRAAMCAALMDGKAWTAGELAKYCDLARSTTTSHLNVLVGVGLVTEIRQGKHRYLRITDDRVAELIEQLGALAQGRLETPSSLRSSRLSSQIKAGRTCYKHLAGELGVQLTDALLEAGHLSTAWQSAPSGCTLLSGWGIEQPHLLVGKPCLDTSERCFHLAGSLGQHLCSALFDMSWIERLSTTRAVRLTATGRIGLTTAGLTGFQASDNIRAVAN